MIDFSLPIKQVPIVKEEDRINLEGKIAIVTGGSRGIGKATCEQLAHVGCTVIGTTRTPPKYSTPKNYQLRELDVRSDSSVKKFIEGVVSDFGHIDILVNNAGIGQYGRLIKSTPENWIDLFQTNLFGQHRVTVAAYDHMIRPHARIITIGSLEGTIPLPYMGLYGISKRALQWWSVLLAMEQRDIENGPTFSLLEPSYVSSTFADPKQVAHYVHTEDLDSQNRWVKLNLVFFPLAISRGMPSEQVAESIYNIACSKEPRQQYFVAKEHEMVIGIGKSIEELIELVYSQPIEKTIEAILQAAEYIANTYGA